MCFVEISFLHPGHKKKVIYNLMLKFKSVSLADLKLLIWISLHVSFWGIEGMHCGLIYVEIQMNLLGAEHIK